MASVRSHAFISTIENSKEKPRKTPKKKNNAKHGSKSKEKPSTPSSSSSEVAADSPAHQEKSTNLQMKLFHSLQSVDPNKLLSSNDDGVGSELNSEDYDDDYDNDDEGTIHPYGPNVNANKLLHTLTQQRQKNSNHKHTTNQANSPDLPPNLDSDNGAKVPIPGPPRDLEARIVSPRFVALSWMEPKINPDEVISYSVYYKMSTSDR